jgi:hypothetical protein
MSQLDPSRYVVLRGSSYGQSYDVYWDKTTSQICLAIAGNIVARADSSGVTADLEFSDEARGDILRRGASSWERLAAATSGQILVGDGTDIVSVAVSGDATLSSAGALTVSDLTIASEARGDVLRRGAAGWERLSAKTSGQILVGDGTDIASVAVSGDVALTSAGVVTIGQNIIRQRSVTISSADIVGTSAGQLSHADGYELVPAPGAQEVIEFISAVLIYDFDTAAYTGGGNVVVRYAGGLQQSAVISAANSFTSAADTINTALPNSASTLTTAGKGVGLNLTTASAITQPGTAAGVARVKVTYRIHTTGL